MAQLQRKMQQSMSAMRWVVGVEAAAKRSSLFIKANSLVTNLLLASVSTYRMLSTFLPHRLLLGDRFVGTERVDGV